MARRAADEKLRVAQRQYGAAPENEPRVTMVEAAGAQGYVAAVNTVYSCEGYEAAPVALKPANGMPVQVTTAAGAR